MKEAGTEENSLAIKRLERAFRPERLAAPPRAEIHSDFRPLSRI